MSRKRTFAVIGLGVFGQTLCERLTQAGASVVAIDQNAELMERVKGIAATSVLIDATDEAALLKAPLEDVDIAIVAIGDSIESSILATALLKRREIPFIVARAVSDIHAQVLRQVGANEIVNLEIDMGARIAQRLAAPEVLDSIPLSADISVAEMYVPKSLHGQSLERLDLRGKMRLNVVAVKRFSMDVDDEGNSVRRENIVFPTPSETLAVEDILFVVGKNTDLDAFRALY
jgi:trk system potassium uptake protein TrkA